MRVQFLKFALLLLLVLVFSQAAGQLFECVPQLGGGGLRLNVYLHLLAGGEWFLLVYLPSMALAQGLVPVWLVLGYRLWVLLKDDCRPCRTGKRFWSCGLLV